MRTRTLLPALLATTLAAGGLALVSAGAADAATVIDVSTAAQLKTALAAAGPGDTIRLADGTYTGNFKATVPGTASARITLTGSARAVLTAGGGYGLHLNGASYWTVQGVTVTGGQKGIMADAANGVVIDSVTVHDLEHGGRALPQVQRRRRHQELADLRHRARRPRHGRGRLRRHGR